MIKWLEKWQYKFPGFWYCCMFYPRNFVPSAPGRWNYLKKPRRQPAVVNGYFPFLKRDIIFGKLLQYIFPHDACDTAFGERWGMNCSVFDQKNIGDGCITDPAFGIQYNSVIPFLFFCMQGSHNIRQEIIVLEIAEYIPAFLTAS
jgi:hypothetical protein